MTFKEHFNGLLIPLKDTSTIFVNIFTAIGMAFDSLKEHSISIVQKFFIDSDLDAFAKERGIYKIANENDVSYKNRIFGAYPFLKNSSTKQGIIEIISNSTSKEFHIRELYLENTILGDPDEKLGITTILRSSSTGFYFVVEFTEELTATEKAYLEEVINLYKPAHIGYHISVV